ncbi:MULTISPECIES: hypothetical protein [Pseudoxanthomonas]|uniref:Uncharacterized protein n=1 Tax=Pseudoxanthomonas winnipegensis TaxID=2480810 RepID=A0A4Q8LKR7_9GAMM|nr:hypothetical protein [Pseudoxanthomonas winnipegensis]RZZ84908.1 hypothetical protein EA663_14100 [Pseudoxanthomonas winnipegensis]RZZ85021.1 hypothetical protein EA662_11255 [Pseudoxanthomonas winnipegensis]TAA31109.1 hypothetical protein EA661_05875 [Pseudoxanthomonas winnipegensis]TAA38290.1 hypothetical protein EAT51_17615 [Pseudoxanthomonas winnipegensis]TBV77614.1 hypothetical protein EYC46_04765 [Pseudoxanthomonas winnipegensis]
MTRALCLLVLLYLFSPLASAQTMNTGLGYCIDGIGEASSTLRSQVAAHTAGRFYGNPPRYDPATKIIYVPPYSCDSFDTVGLYRTLGYLSHELGHHVAGIPDISAPLTRDQYITKMCVWEANAVSNNGVVRGEISGATSGSIVIPLIAQNESTMLSMLASGKSLQEIGQTFCDNNTNSTGKTYTQANGDYYDANYPW